MQKLAINSTEKMNLFTIFRLRSPKKKKREKESKHTAFFFTIDKSLCAKFSWMFFFFSKYMEKNFVFDFIIFYGEKFVVFFFRRISASKKSYFVFCEYKNAHLAQFILVIGVIVPWRLVCVPLSKPNRRCDWSERARERKKKSI